MKRLLAMGDIHGMFDRFLEVWDAVQFRPDEDEIVFLGDYTDRGHQNAAMMKWVMAHEGEPGMVFLRGNHEAMCADGAGHAATLLEGDFMFDYHILGHTPVQLLGKPPVPQVLAEGHVILLDTGSFFSEGRISCMDLLTHEVWQSRNSEP